MAGMNDIILVPSIKIILYETVNILLKHFSY